jgi:hypothetical protein
LPPHLPKIADVRESLPMPNNNRGTALDKIDNRQSTIGNRQSAIGNRKSELVLF